MADTTFRVRPAAVRISSPGILDGNPIPHRYLKDGANLSPELEWDGTPEGTASWALICEDPRGPEGEPFALWLVYNIPPTVRSIPENLSKLPLPPELPGAAQGVNDTGTFGYEGPAPPRGHPPHRYGFTLYALDKILSMEPGARADTLRGAMQGHILANGRLVGTSVR